MQKKGNESTPEFEDIKIFSKVLVIKTVKYLHKIYILLNGTIWKYRNRNTFSNVIYGKYLVLWNIFI